MFSRANRWKLAIAALGVLGVAAYLAWFLARTSSAAQIAARAAAAPRLGCPPGAIELSMSYGTEDGPTEYDASGCGRTAHVECIDRVTGFEQFVRFDHHCTTTPAR